MQGHHDWNKVSDNPTWDNVKDIIQEVMENGDEIPDGDTPNLYCKELKIGNEIVNVSYYTGNGKIQITSSWVKY